MDGTALERPYLYARTAQGFWAGCAASILAVLVSAILSALLPFSESLRGALCFLVLLLFGLFWFVAFLVDERYSKRIRFDPDDDDRKNG